MRAFSSVLPAVLSAVLLSGCERLGIEDPAKAAAFKEAEARAVGAACRHAGRAIEDCYTLNGRAQKAAVFSGWKEMNDYMRENKIETVPPELTAAPKAAKATEDGGEPASTAADDKRKSKPARSSDPAGAQLHGEGSAAAGPRSANQG